MLDKSKLHLQPSVDVEGHNIQRWTLNNREIESQSKEHQFLSIEDLLAHRAKLKSKEEQPLPEVKPLFDETKARYQSDRGSPVDVINPEGRKASFKVAPGISSDDSFIVEQTIEGNRIVHAHPTGSNFASIEEAKKGLLQEAKKFSEKAHYIPVVHSDLDKKGRHNFTDRDGKRRSMEINSIGGDHYGTFLDGIHQDDSFESRSDAVRAGMSDVDVMVNPKVTGSFEEQYEAHKARNKQDYPEDISEDHAAKALYATLRGHGIKDIDEMNIYQQLRRSGIKDISAKDAVKIMSESLSSIPKHTSYHGSGNVAELHGIKYPVAYGLQESYGGYKSPIVDATDLYKYESEIRAGVEKHGTRYGTPKFQDFLRRNADKGKVIEINAVNSLQSNIGPFKTHAKRIEEVATQALYEADNLRQKANQIRRIHNLVDLSLPEEQTNKMEERAKSLETEAKSKVSEINNHIKEVESLSPEELAEQHVIANAHPESHKHLIAVWEAYKKHKNKIKNKEEQPTAEQLKKEGYDPDEMLEEGTAKVRNSMQEYLKNPKSTDQVNQALQDIESQVIKPANLLEDEGEALIVKPPKFHMRETYPGTLYLNDLNVSKARRHQGIASSLISKTVAIADKYELPMTLLVRANEPELTRNLYRKFGFVLSGKHPNEMYRMPQKSSGVKAEQPKIAKVSKDIETGESITGEHMLTYEKLRQEVKEHGRNTQLVLRNNYVEVYRPGTNRTSLGRYIIPEGSNSFAFAPNSRLHNMEDLEKYIPNLAGVMYTKKAVK